MLNVVLDDCPHRPGGEDRPPTYWPRCASPRTQPGAKKSLAEIWGAEDEAHARAAVKAWAEHWVHLRTAHPIESAFATVRHRTKITRGPGSRAAGLAMAFKLIESAQARWRCVNTPHLAALVRAGATSTGRKLAERPEEPQSAHVAVAEAD
jgi:anti-sigma-K factor RskA